MTTSKQTDTRGAVSEEARELYWKLASIRSDQTDPYEESVKTIASALEAERERVRLDEAEQWNAVLRLQDLRACDDQWRRNRLVELTLAAEKGASR